MTSGVMQPAKLMKEDTLSTILLNILYLRASYTALERHPNTHGGHHRELSQLARSWLFFGSYHPSIAANMLCFITGKINFIKWLPIRMLTLHRHSSQIKARQIKNTFENGW